MILYLLFITMQLLYTLLKYVLIYKSYLVYVFVAYMFFLLFIFRSYYLILKASAYKPLLFC